MRQNSALTYTVANGKIIRVTFSPFNADLLHLIQKIKERALSVMEHECQLTLQKASNDSPDRKLYWHLANMHKLEYFGLYNI